MNYFDNVKLIVIRYMCLDFLRNKIKFQNFKTLVYDACTLIGAFYFILTYKGLTLEILPLKVLVLESLTFQGRTF